MKDWGRYKLSEIADVKRGAGSQYINYTDNSGIRLIRINDFEKSSPVYVSRTKDVMRFTLQKDDILIAGTGATAGITFKVKEEFFGMVFSYNAPRIRVKSKMVDSDYLYYYLNSPFILSQQKQLFVGNAQPFLDTAAIGNFSILLPALSEQKKIAEILSTWDKAIDKQTKLIAAKEKRKKALMQKLLSGEVRFKGFEDEWEYLKIKQFTKTTAGGTPDTKRKDYWGGAIRWMNSGELNFKTVTEVEGRITELGLNNSSTKILPKHCVLIGLAGQGKTRGTVAINKIELCTNQSIAAILPNDKTYPEYLYYNLDSRYNELRGLSAGDGGRGGLNLSIINDLYIPLPTIEEQIKIASTLIACDNEIHKLKSELDAISQQKKGLMQNLLTGKIRVRV